MNPILIEQFADQFYSYFQEQRKGTIFENSPSSLYCETEYEDFIRLHLNQFLKETLIPSMVASIIYREK